MCSAPQRVKAVVVQNSTATGIVDSTVALGQPVGLSKEVCLYTGADWLKLSCQSEGGERPVGLGRISLSTRLIIDTAVDHQLSFLSCSGLTQTQRGRECQCVDSYRCMPAGSLFY